MRGLPPATGRWWGRLAAVLAIAGLTPACESERTAPEHPTWADVEPILRAECLHCHGGSAQTTGSLGGLAYRFDFHEMNQETCGEAAAAVSTATFAAGFSGLIANSITSVDSTIRPRMPPAPAPSLRDWQWQTILRWAEAPEKGPIPGGNRAPNLRVTNMDRTVNRLLNFSLVLEDPDGEASLGVLTVGELKLKLDRPGAFVGSVDTSAWDDGEVEVTAVVCDGWSNTNYHLGTIAVAHQ